MANRSILYGLLAGLLVLVSCREPQTGPITVSAIGEAPEIKNPNLQTLDPASAFLVQSVAHGLVRFNAAGEIEPALAQSWIVSDDGLRYTFRIRRTEWEDGQRVTAEQVVGRLRAAASAASRNPLKPLLGAIDEIVPMTEEVLEISLRSPRPNFLQLLAQPEMAIIRNGQGTGPFRMLGEHGGFVSLRLSGEEEDTPEELEARTGTTVQLRGESAAVAVARFLEKRADLVIGGTAGDLPIARAANAGASLVFDPARGLFGFEFLNDRGILEGASGRRALSMAIDREAIVAALGVRELQLVVGLIPAGVAELPEPAQPDWAANPLPMRRTQAAQEMAALNDGRPVTLRVAMPEGPGYRLLFAHIQRDWRMIGVTAEAVPAHSEADLRLIDSIAPVELASWYLRHFTCEASPICNPAADEMMAAARIAPTAANRRGLLANADRILAETTVFIPLTSPVRWSLVSQRLTGFRPNVFARHDAGELIAATP
jgi:oligopeptide transport system substrate-binding protein